jgi:hypothetical protein
MASGKAPYLRAAELPLRALRAAEDELRRLVIGDMLAPMLGVVRQSEAPALWTAPVSVGTFDWAAFLSSCSSFILSYSAGDR